MSPRTSCHLRESACFPRVSGDEPTSVLLPREIAEFSPYEWGSARGRGASLAADLFSPREWG